MSESLLKNINKLSNNLGTALEYYSNIESENILDKDLSEDFVEQKHQVQRQLQDVKRQARVASGRKTVVCFGKFSTGKTTLINAMLRIGDACDNLELPTRDDPTTAIPVRITYDPQVSARGEASYRIIREDGEIERFDSERARKIMQTSDQEIVPSNVNEIVVGLNHLYLSHFDILDLPGRGADFFRAHERIIQSRLHDAAVILWMNGGLDDMFPEREDVTYLRRIYEKSGRPIIPLWNGKQNKGVILEEDDEEEELRREAVNNKNLLGEDIRSVTDVEPVLVWAENARLISDESLKDTGIPEVREAIEEAVDTASAPESIASIALVEIRDSFTDLLKLATGVLWEAIDRKGVERKMLLRAGRKLETLRFECYDEIKSEVNRTAEEIASEKIEPALRDFIEQAVSPGGVIANAWKARDTNPKKIKKKLEENLARALEAQLALNGGREGWFFKELTRTIEDTVNIIDRKIQFFLLDVEEMGITLASGSEKGGDVVISSLEESKEAFIESVKGVVEERMGSMAGTLAEVIVAVLLIAWPKTGTPVDVVIGVLAFGAGLFTLSTFKKRMLGRARAAAWEFAVHIKQDIRKPCNRYFGAHYAELGRKLDLEGFNQINETLRECKQQFENLRAQSHGLDLEVG